MNTKPDSALPSQPSGERERFEKWQLSLGNSWLTRDESAYRSNVTQWQWEGWQAARSSSQNAAEGPSGERERFEAWRQGKGLTRPEEAWQAWQAARSSSPEGEPQSSVTEIGQVKSTSGLGKFPTEIVNAEDMPHHAPTLPNAISAAAPSREWIKRAAEEICNAGLCGPYSFVEEIIARHAAQQEGK